MGGAVGRGPLLGRPAARVVIPSREVWSPGAALGTGCDLLCSPRYGASTMPKDRELIEPNEGDKRYVRRNDEGEFTDSQDDVRRSLSQDRRTDAETEVKKGQ